MRALLTLMVPVLLSGCGGKPASQAANCSGLSRTTMVWISAGSFTMGDDPREPEEGPPRKVA